MNIHIKQNLAGDERILYAARISKAFVFMRPLLILIAYIPFVVLTANESEELGVFIALIGGLSVFIASLAGIFILLTTEIALTTQRIIVKSGFINRKTFELFDDKIEGLVWTKAYWGDC